MISFNEWLSNREHRFMAEFQAQRQSQPVNPFRPISWLGSATIPTLQPHGIVTTWTMPSDADPLLPKKSFIQELREEINDWVKGIRA